jgi:poly-gamma-glutamate capsule biosynthesis protein CapA/YwtB (metallophosphatase superfamily)
MKKQINLLALIFLLPWLSFAQDTTRLSMLFLGDIMQHDSQISDAYDPITQQYNYFPCFQYVKPYTKAVDVAIGNLELTLAGPPYTGYPQFGAPDQLLEALKDMGMDVLVTANNHCVDRGRKGLERTIQMLDSFKILHTGTFSDETERSSLTPLIIERNGFKLALLNYTFGTNGLPVTKPNIVNVIDKETIRRDLMKSSAMKPDAIIVFTHWGTEYQSLPSEWQKDIARFCFDHGASMVIGAHPHVIQPMEWNRKENKLIVYSLGNFVSGQRKRYTDGGAMLRIELEKIKVNDSVSYTGIDTAGYILQWVYRTTAGKNYYVLPVPAAELKLKNYVEDEDSRAAFKTFAADSRELLKNHNTDIRELNSPTEWLIEYSGNYSDSIKIREVIRDASAIKIQDGVMPKLWIGPFTQQDAQYFFKAIKIPSGSLVRKE